MHIKTLARPVRLAALTFATASLLFTTAEGHAADDAIRKKIAAAVDPVMQPLMREHRIPGMAVAVLLDGKRYYFNYGVASLQTKKPVTEETIFELGSVSKTFTATLGSYAQVTGSLALSDSASKYLPALRGSPFDRITLLDLATYTPGGLPLQFPDEVDDHEKMISYYRQWQPTYPAGTHRQYSNPSIGLFGYLAAQSMGMPFDDLMEKKIFPQLGLTRTFVKVPHDQMKNYAQGYTQADKPIRVGAGVLDSEAYGVKSTTADMLKFVATNMKRANGTGDTMQRAIAGTQTGYVKVAGMTQGLGWEMHPYPIALERLVEDNSPSMSRQANEVTRLNPPLPPQDKVLVNKTGSTNGFGAYVAFVPAKGMGIVMLANKSYPISARVKAAFEVLTGLEVQMGAEPAAMHRN